MEDTITYSVSLNESSEFCETDVYANTPEMLRKRRKLIEIPKKWSLDRGSSLSSIWRSSPRGNVYSLSTINMTDLEAGDVD